MLKNLSRVDYNLIAIAKMNLKFKNFESVCIQNSNNFAAVIH